MLTKALSVASSVIKLIASISLFTNYSLVLSIDESLYTLTNSTKASPAKSLISVISRYFIIASGNLEFSRNCGTISVGRYSFSFLEKILNIIPVTLKLS
jgi:hypothetical protein